MSAFRKLIFVCAWCLLCGAMPAGATIDYTVSLAEPEKHLFHVTMSIPNVKGDLVVQLPAWNATYQIRDFAQRVQDVRAADGSGAGLRITKLDKQTWSVRASRSNATVTVKYDIFWDEASPFSSQLNANHAFINFASVLMYVPGRREEEIRLAFADVPAGWRVALALKGATDAGAFVASKYDELVDAPAEVGTFEEFRLEAMSKAGIAKIRVLIHGEKPIEPAAREKLTDTLRRIVTTQTALMRDIPFEEYIFIYHIGAGGGGMEHANSTAIHSGSLETLAGVSAHEFFHLWNVKRIRPKTLEPVDYTKENWTRALWFAEGVTSTYGSYTLVRSGLWTAQQYYDDLADEIAMLEARPARKWKSVEEASLDAWLERYPNYRRAEFSISYYNKGQILGVLLDILIREATQNKKSLDDVMRELNGGFARKGRTYDDSNDIRAIAERVAGRSFEEFFRRYLAGTDELPCAEILGRAGLTLEPKKEKGYKIEEKADATPLQRRIREGLLRGTTE